MYNIARNKVSPTFRFHGEIQRPLPARGSPADPSGRYPRLTLPDLGQFEPFGSVGLPFWQNRTGAVRGNLEFGRKFSREAP
jgi:hypothetical protein